MTLINCILDACTFINILNIDDNQFLLKKLDKININICETVFKEVQINGKIKIEKTEFKDKLSKLTALRERDENISSLRKYIITNRKIETDIDDIDFFKKIKLLVNYSKDNGEFFSTALGFYLSRYCEMKIFFHTDDVPAREKFQEYFLYHQIGIIEDSIDLLILLYRLSDEDFKYKMLMIF